MTRHDLYIGLETTVEEAKLIAETHGLSALPLSHEGTFVGVLDKHLLQDAPPEASLADFQGLLDAYCVFATSPWDEVMEQFAAHRTHMLPVVAAPNSYMGYYHLSDFVSQLSETPFIKEVGHYLILSKEENNYSFAQIAQIVETNNGRLLAMYLSNFSEGIVHITLKISCHQLTEILQSFRRYGYGILVEKEDDFYREELKEISRYFEKYITF